MRYFIFLTQEGLTKTPNNVDIENLQVLGIAKGKNKKVAFKNFVKENDYLLQTAFDEVAVMELRDKEQHIFSLKNHE